jgi:PEGA domain
MRSRGGGILTLWLATAWLATTWLATTWLSGCATIVHGTNQQVRVETTPPGAKASVGSQSITTPGELSLPREFSYIVNFEKPGYAPTYAHISQATSNYVWGNLLLGGFMGASIDYANGAAYDLGPTTVSATLEPIEPIADGESPPPPGTSAQQP